MKLQMKTESFMKIFKSDVGGPRTKKMENYKHFHDIQVLLSLLYFLIFEVTLCFHLVMVLNYEFGF